MICNACVSDPLHSHRLSVSCPWRRGLARSPHDGWGRHGRDCRRLCYAAKYSRAAVSQWKATAAAYRLPCRGRCCSEACPPVFSCALRGNLLFFLLGKFRSVCSGRRLRAKRTAGWALAMSAKRKVVQHTSHTNTCMANRSILWHARKLLIHRCSSLPGCQNCKTCSRSRFLAPGRRTCQECANAEAEASRSQVSHERAAREEPQSSTREPSLLLFKRSRSAQPPAAAAAATASQSAFLSVDARSGVSGVSPRDL